VGLAAGGTWGGNWSEMPKHPFEHAQEIFRQGGIDDLRNLAYSPVFIHSGSND